MITLTPENAEAITKLAALIAWTPDKLANHLLAETLEMFADRDTGALKDFLGSISYPDRESAQRALDRVTQMTRANFGGRLPGFVQKRNLRVPGRHVRFLGRVHRPVRRT